MRGNRWLRKTEKMFVLVGVWEEKKLMGLLNDTAFRPSALLPSYGERYFCFSQNREFTFDELMERFLHGDDGEQIGAVALIAERFPRELYGYLCERKGQLSRAHRQFLLDEVVPGYLPLILPRERRMDYVFGREWADDVWVKMRALLLETA